MKIYVFSQCQKNHPHNIQQLLAHVDIKRFLDKYKILMKQIKQNDHLNQGVALIAQKQQQQQKKKLKNPLNRKNQNRKQHGEYQKRRQKFQTEWVQIKKGNQGLNSATNKSQCGNKEQQTHLTTAIFVCHRVLLFPVCREFCRLLANEIK